jgi:peptidyl-tRNA hydrolase
MDPKDYVLQDFSKDELKFMPEFLARASDAAIEFVMKGLNAAMNKYNGGTGSCPLFSTIALRNVELFL